MELSEPVSDAVASLRKLDAKASKALIKAAADGGGTGSRADRLLALLQLARWLQLYVMGDATNVDIDLAAELTAIHRAVSGTNPIFETLHIDSVSPDDRTVPGMYKLCLGYWCIDQSMHMSRLATQHQCILRCAKTHQMLHSDK